MPRSSKLQLSPTALTFTAGVLTGLVIGLFAGYAARGLIADDHERERVEQHDIWNPYGTHAPIEVPLEVYDDAPAPSLDGWARDEAPFPADDNPDDTSGVGEDAPNANAARDDDAMPEGDGQAQAPGARTDAAADRSAGVSAANPLGLDLAPSPANPTIEHVKPGGLRVAEDPDSSYDAPAP